jgi:hypothetical protein
VTDSELVRPIGPGGCRWPASDAVQVLFGTDPTVARTSTALRVTTTVPLAPDATAASLLLDRHPPAVARHLDLQRESSSSRWARLFVVSAGADWQRDLIRDAAAFAAGPSTRLAIADHDHDHDLARPLRPAAESQRGHRLFSVAALSRHGGSAGAGREMRVVVAAPCRRGHLLAHRAHRCPGRHAHRAGLRRELLGCGPHGPPPRRGAGRTARREFVRDLSDELVAELAATSHL